MNDIVFELLAEGGSLIIKRKRNHKGDVFIYRPTQQDKIDESLCIKETNEYQSFEEAFFLINSKHPWFRCYPSTIHEDFREYVLAELIISLNRQNIKPDDFKYPKQDFEGVLPVRLHYGRVPMSKGLQNIIVNSLVEIVEFDNQDFLDETSNKAEEFFSLNGKYSMWTDEPVFYPITMDILRNSTTKFIV